MKPEKAISPSGREFNSNLLKEDLDWALKLRWTKSIWKPKDSLAERNGRLIWLYTRQAFDNEKIELEKNGWAHDHCDICSVDIRENDSCAISENQIICEKCYHDFIKK